VDYQKETPFDGIEGAQEYLELLADAVLEAKRDVEADLGSETNSRFPRRLEALRLVLYKLDKLEEHLKISRRALNDLRTLRRLLLEQKAAVSDQK
jgi:hypothetical protein